MPTSRATDDALDRQAREIQNVIDACRRAMADLTVEEKAVAVDQLRGWVELDEAPMSR